MNTQTQGIQRKIYEMMGAELEQNCIKGAANVMGILDRGRDVTFPGFFRRALPEFRKNGFIAIGHNWNDLPVAMPTAAKEVGNILYSEAVFHSTQEAQDARTVCRERLENDLTVGLSVGFMPDYDKGVRQFDNGTDLLSYAEKECRCDMGLFDIKGITAHKSYCWGLLPGGCAELFEWSIVPVPMNQESFATEAKSLLSQFKHPRELEAFLREAGFSRKQAVAVTNHGFKGLQRDADVPEIRSAPTVQQLQARLLQLRMGASAHEREIAGACASNGRQA